MAIDAPRAVVDLPRDVLPALEGDATITEMVRAFWPFTSGRRWLLACNIVLSVGLFVLVAVLPLLTGRLLETALAAARADTETDRYVSAFLESQDVTRLVLEWGDVPRSDARATALGVRAATLVSLSAESEVLLDSLFPGGRSYESQTLLRQVTRQFGDARTDWQQLVVDVVEDGSVGRDEIEVLRESGSESPLTRAEAVNFIVSFLALDDDSESQRDEWRASTLRVGLLQFGLVLVGIIVLRLVTVSLALRFTLRSGRRLQDEVFRRVHDTVAVESGLLGRPSMLSRCTSYVDRVQSALLAAQTTGVPAVANLVLSLVLVVWIDSQIGLILTLFVVLFEVVRRLLSSRWSRLSHDRLDRNTTLSEIADAAISSVASTRMSHTESFVRRRFGDQADVVSRDTIRLARFGDGFAVSAFAIGQGGVLVAIVVIGVARGDLALSTATAAVLYARSLGDAIANIPGVVIDLHEAAPYMRRLRRLLMTRERRSDPIDPTQVPEIVEALTFEAATYTHPDGAVGCHELDVTCDRGRWTVVVSASASSRTGVIAAAAGMDDLAGGEVRVGPRSVAHLAAGEVRRVIAVLAPMPDIVEASLRDNVALAAPDADASRIEDALVRAGLHVLCAVLPHGADTVLGSAGHPLSPADRIRVGLARVIASGSPVVVINDPTPALDRDAADDVWMRARASLADRVVLVATTRLDAIDEADQVLVLENGRLVAQGTRGDLLARSRSFNELWRQSTGSSADVLDLAAVPSLRHLGPEVLDRLGARLVTERYAETQVVFGDGDVADRLFMIVDGAVELSVDGRRVASLHAGDHFGELTLDEGQTRTMTARAITPVVLRSLHRLAISGGAAGMLERSRGDQLVYRWLVRHGATSAHDLAAALIGHDAVASAEAMVADGLLLRVDHGGDVTYRLAGVRRRRSTSSGVVLDGLLDGSGRAAT
jgi:ABC-type multidrug transport system fused ATPase/permease subunit